MKVPVIPPTYSEDSKLLNGYQVLNKYFDILLERTPNLFAFGEDVGYIGDVNQGLAGMQEKYGKERVFDTGIRENTIMGQAIGMAIRGLKPIAEIQYLDYLIYGLQPLTDDLATLRYRSNSIQQAPMIVRTRGHRLEGIWHSGSPIGMMTHSLRGIYLCVPRNMTVAVGFYNTLVQSDDPGIVIECLNGYRLKENLPDNIGEYTVPLGVPEVLETGTDITLVTYGSCVRIAEEGIALLKQRNISVELIDVQTILPFDLEHRIVESLKKTNRIVFMDEDVPGGATSFMMQEVLENQDGYRYLDAKPKTLTAKAHRPPFGSDGDYFSKPNSEDVFNIVYNMMNEADPVKISCYVNDQCPLLNIIAMTNLTMPKVSILVSILTLLCSVTLFAQPPNDDCATATSITIGANVSAATLICGTTVGGTPSNTPEEVCSGSWFFDDVWYSFTTPAILPTDQYLKIQLFFAEMAGDIPTVGLAFYEGCGSTMPAIHCFSDAGNILDEMSLYVDNLFPSTTYYLRVWSGGSATDNSGTFRIGTWWEPLVEEVVLWGDNPGEGDFDGGLNNWTTQIFGDSSFWVYKLNASTNGFFRNETISSPTAFNGAMVFDADSMNDPQEGIPYPILVGELISPVIDCSTFDAVSLKFYSAYAPLNGDAYIAVSTDGGTTWSPDIEFAEDVVPNSLEEVGVFRKFFFPELANQPQARVKFTFNGDYYYWIIDDVQLIEPQNNNLIVMDDFYAIAPNAIWPRSQVEEFGFLANVANIGVADQPNTRLNIAIIDNGTSVVVYNNDLNYGTLLADSLAEDEAFFGCFEPSGTSITSYTGVYTISSDSIEFDPSDNMRSFTFEVSDTTFAKENGITIAISPEASCWETTEAHSWAFGNFYHIVNDDSSGGLPWHASSASFGIGNPEALDGRELSIVLYEWTEDTNNDQNMDPDERTAIGIATYQISASDPTNEFINVTLEPFQTGNDEVYLTSGTNYVLMVEYQIEDQIDMLLSGAEPWDYTAQQFRTDPNEFGDKPFRAAEMLGIGGNLSEESYSSAGFFAKVVPAVRLHISQSFVESVVHLDEENIIKVAPNPASDFISLNIDLVNPQEKIEVSLSDVSGRVVLQTSYNNVSKETFNYDLSQFAAGTYFLNLSTEEGARAVRFIIQR